MCCIQQHLVESNEPVEELQRKDYEVYEEGEIRYPRLADNADIRRVDYFDLSYGPSEFNKLDIHHLAGKACNPVLVFIHGGGWTRRDKDLSRFIGPRLIEQGYTVVSINYCLTNPGATEEDKANFHPKQIDDCARALKWIIDNIEDYGGDPENIAIMGHSSGAHLVALLICDRKWQEKYKIKIENVKCWVGLSGIYDLELEENYYHDLMTEYIGALIGVEGLKKEASPINYVEGVEPPGLLIHGTNDYLVPIFNTLRMCNRLSEKGAEVELFIAKKAGHMDYFARFNEEKQPVPEKVIGFLENHLLRKNV